MWAGSNFACVIFFYFFIPEMKGRTLEELDELFVNRVSVRNFPKYQCQLREDVVNDVVHQELGEEKDIGTSLQTEDVEADQKRAN